MSGPRNEDMVALEGRLAEAGALIDPVLKELIPPGGRPHISEAVWYHLSTGGKRIRPAICVLTCEQLGGDPSRAICFAAAVELLHNMFLIHDDVEDGDTVRRDQPAVWVRYGVANAINVADYMIGVACQAVVRSPVSDERRVRLVRAFNETVESTCCGQALDLNLRARPDVTVQDYLEMVRLKTGRYLALGMAGGAIIADADEEVVRRIEDLGECMGAAFQIRDDMIDLTVGKGRGGHTGNDVREGKSSILYAHALAAAEPDDREDLVRIMAKPRDETTDEDVARVRRLYEELGSLEFARAEADRLVAAGFETIDRIPVHEKDFLRQLARYMVSRTK